MKNASYGKPDVGGDYELIDCKSNKRISSESFKGKFQVLYFGFTHCPDVCPDELEKMSLAITKLDKLGIDIVPVFISVDPQRDTAPVVKKYIEGFIRSG
jgi:protein SCO1